MISLTLKTAAPRVEPQPACACMHLYTLIYIYLVFLDADVPYPHQGFIYRPDRPNRRGPVPVYRSGLAGNRSVQVEFKFEFKKLSSTGSYRYTGRLDRFTGRFDRFEFKSKFKIACVTGLERYTGRFDRFTKWALMGRLIFFLFFFGLTLNARKIC